MLRQHIHGWDRNLVIVYQIQILQRASSANEARTRDDAKI